MLTHGPRIIIEVNATDDDSGIQMFVDGEGWDRLIVFDPKWKRVLRVRGRGARHRGKRQSDALGERVFDA